jgi:uncharacterized protein
VAPAPLDVVKGTMSTTEVFDTLVAELLPAIQVVYEDRLISLAVFGSVGRRCPRPDSDLDFLIVADRLPLCHSERRAELDCVETLMAEALLRARQRGVETLLSPVVKSREAALAGTPLFLDMVEDAKIIHDQDGFLSGVLARLRDRMQALGSKRIWRGTRWYWVLKPDYKPGEVIQL